MSSFGIEMFTFISVYVYAYQLIELKRTPTFFKILKNKSRRLILPSIFFSLIYYFMFKFDNLNNTDFINALYSIIIGQGDLLFLPMLFWCF